MSKNTGDNKLHLARRFGISDKNMTIWRDDGLLHGASYHGKRISVVLDYDSSPDNSEPEVKVYNVGCVGAGVPVDYYKFEKAHYEKLVPDKKGEFKVTEDTHMNAPPMHQSSMPYGLYVLIKDRLTREHKRVRCNRKKGTMIDEVEVWLG